MFRESQMFLMISLWNGEKRWLTYKQDAVHKRLQGAFARREPYRFVSWRATYKRLQLCL